MPIPPPRPEGSSTAEVGRKKRKSKPTSKARAKKQRTKDRYAHAREDAQLEGLIPTTPEEALKPERVSSSAQGNQPLSELVAQAIRKGWAVDEAVKPGLVDEMVQIVLDGEMPAKAKVSAFNALRMADAEQWAREHPEAKKGAVGNTNIGSVNVQINMEALAVLNRMLDDPGRSVEEATLASVPGAPGDGGPAEVGEPTAHTAHQP